MSAAERDCLAEQFRTQYGHREHLYGVLLAEFADDLQAGGVTAQIMAGHLDDPRGNAVHLRLLAGLHRIVLRGDAPELEDFYPSLGGTADPHDAWPLVHRVVTAYAGELHTALDLPPQTNEVGRSAVLAVGLFAAVRRTGIRRIRLLEPGASAGLNLNVDQYRVIGPDWSWGPADSPLVLDTQATGVLPEELEIVERRGCDIAPVDAADPDNARYLTSFVWPWQLERHQRLAAALAPLGIVRGTGPGGDRADIEPIIAGGVAGVDLNQSGLRYFDIHHSADDTLERIDPEQLRQNVAAWTTMLAIVADAPEDIAAVERR